MNELPPIRIMFLGDIVGRVGRTVLKNHLTQIKEEYTPDLVIANGENASGGVGIEPGTADEIYAAGVQIITGGNHVWNKREIVPYLDKNRDRMVRPHNYPGTTPGSGWLITETARGVKVAVANLIARVFMPDLVDCPFRAAMSLIENQLAEVKIRFFDFHGEATSEKCALGRYLDGKVSVVVGTHTHVQTADERIFSGGTAYISDVGMCGPIESVIGVEAEPVIERFITGRPARFEAARGLGQINGVVIDVDPSTGRALSIKRINRSFKN